MKALNYLEWYFSQKGDYKWYDKQNEFINHSYKVLDFYNQPFSVDMLVNPIILETTGEVLNGKYAEEWQQSESLRLFDGWDKLRDNSYMWNNIYVWYDVELKAFVMSIQDYERTRHWEFQTVNEFITLINSMDNNYNLQWNESNEKVKEMFK